MRHRQFFLYWKDACLTISMFGLGYIGLPRRRSCSRQERSRRRRHRPPWTHHRGDPSWSPTWTCGPGCGCIRLLRAPRAGTGRRLSHRCRPRSWTGRPDLGCVRDAARAVARFSERAIGHSRVDVPVGERKSGAVVADAGPTCPSPAGGEAADVQIAMPERVLRDGVVHELVDNDGSSAGDQGRHRLASEL
jgi:hypothetical protein